ncbi:peptidoglycan recognition protein family protein [Pseudokineococcus sp. 1T1Z-3]|uniref:peptidoglycan recognition protein family protein n=1 Tax=Pseudokineococcus sp. 1T1Z-3 TaxID=3132745 RepID=UPI0030B3101A
MGRDGRSDLPGPLAQWGVGRTGRIRLIAAGLANHAGRTFHPYQGNSRAVGVEVANNGTTEAWSGTVLLALIALNEELLRQFGLPIGRLFGHKEIAAPAGRGSDPHFLMGPSGLATTS